MFIVLGVILLLLSLGSGVPENEKSLNLKLENNNEWEFSESDATGVSVNGELLIESDMRLTEEQRSNRQAKNNLWPKRAIKFIITASSQPDRAHIMSGISQWQEDTCLTFEEKPEGYQGEVHLKFIKLARECSAPVGFIPSALSGMEVRIGEGCSTKGVVMHEIGHAIGLKHEQSRSDRDSFVHINMQNIKKGFEQNFVKDATARNYSVPYDMTSLMHYGPTFFSANGLPTLAANEIHLTGLMGHQNGLSHRDKNLANLMYDCSAECSSTAPECHNGGFLDKSCKCICPPRIGGEQCEQVPDDYQYYEICGDQHVTSEGKIASQNWPGVYLPGKTCFWVIKAPEGKKVHLKFTSFKMLYRYPATGKCEFDKVEVYLDDNDTPDRDLCSNEGQDLELSSSGRRLAVSMKSYKFGTYPSMQKGFEATVSFF